MTDTSFRLPTKWPNPADAAGAEGLRERFAAVGEAEAALAARPEIAALLACLGGNSTYLADLAVREAASVRALVEHGPDQVVDDALAEVDATRPETARPQIAATLRHAKRVVALVTAIADIGGIWPLEKITGALTALAEAALHLSVAHLLRTAHDTGELRLPDPEYPLFRSGFTVLGMGKLGASELNYSSDIDLILLYDPAAGVYADRANDDGAGAFYSRLARNLVSLMEARDANGYVFRTDLRLRPDPGSTPPAMAIPAAITYYESMGENWERAALSKARPVSGDLDLGARFMTEIRPFIWRRGLDFAAVADISAMKRRIDTHKGGALSKREDVLARIAGHNVKLGEGGIREIEFVAQTLELVWGGRDPSLREPTTLGALRLLADSGHMREAAATELSAAYSFLRSVEHRLQMIADRQTHSLPASVAEVRRFATFMGFSDAAEFGALLLRHLVRVRTRYAEIFEHVPDLPDTSGTARLHLDFKGNREVPDSTVETLKGLGYENISGIVSTVRGWAAGHVRALRSERARDLIGQMLPMILSSLSRQPQPDQAFVRFDAFLGRLPAGVQILSLFQRNPHLLDRVAAVLGAALPLAEHLARHPAALDGLLLPEDGPVPNRLLQRRLQDARLLEDAIATTRRTVREEDFNLSVATMEGRLSTDSAGRRRTRLADAAISALLPRVLADFTSRFGRVPGGAMAVVAMGKAGGREMLPGSDLDLMLIYDHPPEVTETVGARAMAPSQWFVRATQAFVAALTAPGADGSLYAVDMRLRPSGNQGPVAVSLTSFTRYHAEKAWTWERMALTRARTVTGRPELVAKVRAAITEAIIHAGDAETILGDVRAMRARMLRDLPPSGPWDVKLRAGGLIDVEFIAQTLQLIHARAMPELCSPTTRTALSNLARAGILPQKDATFLIRADRIWRTVQGMIRITVGRDAKEALPDASARPLLRAAGQAGAPAIDVPELRATLDDVAAQVRAAFISHIGEIAHEPR